MPKRKKRTVKKQKEEETVCEAKKVAAASSTSQCGDDGDELSSFTSVPLLRTQEEGVKGGLTSHFMCNYCEFSAESKVDLISHMRKHMIKCTKCQFSSLSRKEVTQHCKDEHDADFEEKAHEVATSSTEVEMDKDPCSACVFCKFMTYSTEHLERHTTLKHPGMLPKSVAKMVTKLASTQIRQGDVRFYLAISGKGSTEDSKLVSSSPSKEVSSEPIEIEDENYIDVKPKFEPIELKVQAEFLDKQNHLESDSKSSLDTHISETFTQQLAKRMKMEKTSVRSEADTSETDTKPEKGVKVETIYCLTCPYSNVLIDKLKCHTLVQHPLGAAVATYSSTSESSLADFTFFCVKEECPYSTGDLKEFQKHIMLCCSAIKSLKVIERERLKSTVTFIFEIKKKHSLNMEQGFNEFASPVMPQEDLAEEESTAAENPSQPLPSKITNSNFIPSCESQSPFHENLSSNLHPFVPKSDIKVNSQSSQEAHMSIQQALPEAFHKPNESSNKPHKYMGTAPTTYDHLSQNQVSPDMHTVNTQRSHVGIFRDVQKSNDSNQITSQGDRQMVHKVDGPLSYLATGHQTLQYPSNNSASPQYQAARGRKRNIQGQSAHLQRTMPPSHMQSQQHLPLQGLPRPRVPLTPQKPSFRGQGMYRGRGRPSQILKPGESNVADDDVIVTAVVRMSPSNQRGRLPPPARGRSSMISSQRLRGPGQYHNQMPSRPRGRGAPVRPNFAPILQPRPFDMSRHFEALACAANPNEEDDLQIVAMTPGKDGAMGHPKAVDASRFSYCCLHCGKDQGSKNVMKQHMKACHNDTLLGAFTNIDTGHWLYFCPQLHCAFMTYNEQRLSDHLQKCCDPEKLKAFDFGVAMNNLKSMKIRQMEVRSVSGSQNDPIDLDGRGMRDRFSSSLNDAFDDIVVNTTGRQMVRPPVSRPLRALPSQQSQAQRMPIPYQPIGVQGKGRGTLHTPQQPIGRSPRSYGPRGRLPGPRQPTMYYRTPGPTRPVGRSPGFLPPQAATADRRMAHMQRPRMPHPHTRQKPQPTSLLNPIIIDVDPDSPERPKDNPPDGFDNFDPAATPQSQLCSSTQSGLIVQPVGGDKGLVTENQNPDQISSNFLNVPDIQLNESDNFTPPQKIAFENSRAANGSSSSIKSFSILEQQADPEDSLAENHRIDTNQLDLENPPEELSDATQITALATHQEKPQGSLISSASLVIQGTSKNSGANGEGEASNSEHLTPFHHGYPENHQDDASADDENFGTFMNEHEASHANSAQSESFQNLDVASDSITDEVPGLHSAHQSPSRGTMISSQVTPFPGENLEPLTDGQSSFPFIDKPYISQLPAVTTDAKIAISNTHPLSTTKSQLHTAREAQPGSSDAETSVVQHMQDTFSADMESEHQIDTQCGPMTVAELESFADTHSVSARGPLQSSLSSDMQYAMPFGKQTDFSKDMHSESLYDKQSVCSITPVTEKQPFPSTEMHSTSSLYNRSSPSCNGQSIPSDDPQPVPSIGVEYERPSNEIQSGPLTSGQSALSNMQSVPSTNKQSMSPTNVQFVTSTDSQSVPLTAMQSLPSTDMQSVLSTDMHSASTTDLQSVSSTDLQFMPSTDMQFVPSVDMQSVPSTEMSTIPSTYMQSVPSTEMSTIPSTYMQSAPTAEMQSVPLTDMQSVPLTDMQSVRSTDMPSVPLTDMQSVRSTDMPSVPLTDIRSVPSTDMQSVPLADIQLASTTEMQSVPLTDMQSVPSTDMQSAPTDMQSMPSTDMQSAPTTDMQSMPSTDLQSAPTTDVQSVPSSDNQSVPSTDSQSGPLTDLESIPQSDTRSDSSTATHAKPLCDTQSLLSTNVQLTPSVESQHVPKTRNSQDEHQENIKVVSTNHDSTSVKVQPVAPTSTDTKAMVSQHNHWSSELFDEEERINAVVLEKVFAKVPDMPKTLSRRLVFKFKQYANYKNVKITPDSKVIDEFVSKISYKRSSSADGKNTKSTQGTVNNTPSPMSTRSGRHFPDPSLEVKATFISPSSKKDSSIVEYGESEKVKHVKCTSMDNNNLSQVNEGGVHKTHEATVKKSQIAESVKIKSTFSDQQFSHTSESHDCYSEPETVPREIPALSPVIKEHNKTNQEETAFNAHSSDSPVTMQQRESLSAWSCSKEEDNRMPSESSEGIVTSGNTLLHPTTYSCYNRLQTSTENETELSKSTSGKSLIVKEITSDDNAIPVNTTSQTLVKTSFRSLHSVEEDSTASITSDKVVEAKDSSQENSLEAQVKQIQSASEIVHEPYSCSDKDIVSSDHDLECGSGPALMPSESMRVCQENTASLDQAFQKGNVQHPFQGDESFQVQPSLNHKSFDISKSLEKDSHGSTDGDFLTSMQDQRQDDLIKTAECCQEGSSMPLPFQQRNNKSDDSSYGATNVEKLKFCQEKGPLTTDLIETHVILPERSIQFSGLFASLVQQVKKAEKSGSTDNVKGNIDIVNNSQEAVVSTHSESNLKNSTEPTKFKSQSNCQQSSRSFHFNSIKLRQVLKRVWKKGKFNKSRPPMSSNENEFPVCKKMRFRRASAPEKDIETNAISARCLSPESNSCPGQPSGLDICQSSQNDFTNTHISCLMSEKDELQVKSLEDDRKTIVKENMQSDDQTLNTDNEEHLTIASLIAANLAAEKEQINSSSSPRLDTNDKSFLENMVKSDLKQGSQGGESVQRSNSPSNDIDKFIQSLPGTSKEETNDDEKPMVVDKVTGRLILKVKKHNLPRIKATKLSPNMNSTIESQEIESIRSEDNFVRRSLRERKVVHRDENEITEIDELMSEDDDEYHVEEDSDAYSSDSNGGREENFDHSQQKRIRKTKSPPDPTAFDVKLKGKYKCWQCRKVFLKCGFAKSHILKKHIDKGLCAIDLGQSEFLGNPQLLLFCPKKCRYATLSIEGLKNHMANCEREILSPQEITEKFVDTDYDEVRPLVLPINNSFTFQIWLSAS